MGAVISAVASCAGGLVGACACSCAQAACSSIGRRGSLIPYFVLLFISTLIAFILRYYGGPIVIDLTVTKLSLCKDEASNCYGFGAMARVSASLTAFFLLHVIVTSIAKLKWVLKAGLLTIITVGFWFIPDNFYDVYIDISRFTSSIFLILQLVILVDFAYSWQSSWTSDERPWHKQVLAVSAALLILSIVFIGLSYHWFAGSGCQLEQFFVSFTLCISVLFTVLAVCPFIEGGGLLPAAVVATYSVYLLFTALSSDPSSCNRLYPDGGAEKQDSSNRAQSLLNVAMTSITVVYAAYNVTSSNSMFGGDEVPEADSASALLPSGPSESSMEAGSPPAEPAEESVPAGHSPRQYRRFFGVFVLASMYMCMVLTNWGERESVDDPTNHSDSLAKQNMWIKIASGWVVSLMFIWSLIAPRLFPDRDFS